MVIPAYDEANTIDQTINNLPTFVDYIVIIDDGSTDQTAEIAVATNRAGLHVIHHPTNRGVGGAISTGYAWSIGKNVDAVVVVGADGQMDPKEMKDLLDPIVEGYADYVKGERLSHPDVFKLMPKIRLLGTWVLTQATRSVTGYSHLHDTQCGYTAITTSMLRKIPIHALYPRYGFPNDLLVKLSTVGARVVECSVRPIYASNTSKMKIHRVVLPLSFLLLKAGWVRLNQRFGRRVLSAVGPQGRQRDA